MTANPESLARLEQHLGLLLKAGVTLSAIARARGRGMWVAGAGSPPAEWLLRAGLFVLIGTPILRVVVSLVEYLRMRDWFFVATTLAVLGVLIASLVTALRA